MSETEPTQLRPSHSPVAEILPPEDPPSSGPSLVLLWSLVAFALIAAFAAAAWIVLPFYRRR
jgi:hypothetical protein